jgi:hypothetical protein
MYALNAITRMEEDLERMKALLDERNKEQRKVAMLERLVEELANEFMAVGNDLNTPDTFTGDEGFVYNRNERLAEKVNKALGLVK